MSTELQRQEEGQLMAKERNYRRPYYLVNGGKENYEIRVFMPGVSKDRYKVSLHRNELYVEGHKDTAIEPAARWLHRETDTSDYKLHLQLNVDVDADGIVAKSEDGILTITLPVAQEARPRQIAIS
jgi:HSP20 family protein